MYKPFRLVMLSILLASVLFAGSSAQAAPAAGQGLSPAGLLNPDGSLRLDGGYSGSFDLAEWGVHLDLRRGPILAPASAFSPGWNPMGGGLNSDVHAIAVSGSDVYVGGLFINVGGNANADYIAKWDGSSWSALGSGLNATVYAIAISGSDVYVGGLFTNAGGNANADYIAKWNGSSWSALGSGLTGCVLAIAVSGSDVFVGGTFTNAGGNASEDHIAKWNGSIWSALGSGLNSRVEAIAISGSNVYAGGRFTDAGGNTNADYIAKWSGSSWSALGSGLSDYVTSIAIRGNNVYVGGGFTAAGGIGSANHIAKWNGSSWSALGSGLSDVVYAITVTASSVYAGGGFTSTGGGGVMNHIAKWNGSQWSAFGSGLNQWVSAVAVSGSEVYAGGDFTDAAGNANADYIALYYTPPTQKTFLSQAAYDGYILESSENSNTGGSMNASATTFRLGDDSQNRQYRSILSFDTSSLPDTATILYAVLKIKQSGSPVGTNPFTILGNLYVDIRKGAFGSSPALQWSDFNAAATATKVAYVNMTPTSGWYSAPLNATGLSKINKAGLTQLRLYFNLDDNNNHVADYMKFISGNYSSSQPKLVITYILP